MDDAGNVFITGTARLAGFKVVIYTAKYRFNDGFPLRERNTVPPGAAANTFPADDAKDTLVDAAGNVVITGSSQSDDTAGDYFTLKYDNDGELLWEERLNGNTDSGTDIAAAVVVDQGGNVAVTGTARKAPPSAFSEIITVRYNRFLLSVGDRVKGTGLTEKAVVSSLATAAIANNGALAVRIGIKDGKKEVQRPDRPDQRGREHRCRARRPARHRGHGC